jgi:hypothetical protein
MFRMLQIFQRNHGHCDVPYTARRDSLGFWLMQQRLAGLAGDLDPVLCTRLQRLGVEFDHHDLIEMKRERRWNDMFDALKDFKQGAGHSRVPASRPEYASLYSWLAAQRHKHANGKLRVDRRRRLEGIGVRLERLPHDRRLGLAREKARVARERRWKEKFDALQAFKDQRGHCLVPCSPGEFRRLYQWIARQRRLHGLGKLSCDRQQRLMAIGVELGPLKPANNEINRRQWERRYQELVSFQERFGHCSIPRGWPENPALANWLSNQRQCMGTGRMQAERRERLLNLGVVLGRERHRVSWTTHYEALIAFQRAHGHCRVPEGWPENPALACWVNYQRVRFAQGRLPSERQRLLQAVGFVFDSGRSRLEVSGRWEKNFAKLLELQQRHGDCNAPLLTTADRELRIWAKLQRGNYQQGTLSAERVRRLEAVGFLWCAYEAMWDRQFQQLLQFRNEHGHCNVSGQFNGIPGLGSWVNQQRQYKRLGRLSPERIRRLDEVGFVWQRENPRREKHLQALIEFKRRHGHFDVPSRWPENPSLAIWTANQRKFYAQGCLPPGRQAQFEAIGFNWQRATVSRAGFDARWERMFAALVAFKEQHGHCHVGESAFGDDPDGSIAALVHWVGYQRTVRRQGKLAPEHLRRLDELGFDWEPLADTWEKHFAELVEFHRRHDHCRVSRRVPETRPLHRWLEWQRKYMQLGRLEKDRADRLLALGIKPMMATVKSQEMQQPSSCTASMTASRIQTPLEAPPEVAP